MIITLRDKTMHPDLTKTLAKYEPLLFKIATSLGIPDKESHDLMNQVTVHATNNYFNRQMPGLKIWCSKAIVHKCILKLSQSLFSQNCFLQIKPRVLGYSQTTGSAPADVHDLYLSLRVIYILQKIIGFNEMEIAEILNTTSVEVKKKLHKAVTLLAAH